MWYGFEIRSVSFFVLYFLSFALPIWYLLLIKLDEIDTYVKGNWSEVLVKAIAAEGAPKDDIFDRENLSLILLAVNPLEESKLNLNKLQEYLGSAIEMALRMRLERPRFVSTFPVQGAEFQRGMHSLGGDEQIGLIRMCTFPGIITRESFLGSSPEMQIYPARVQLESWFEEFKFDRQFT